MLDKLEIGKKIKQQRLRLRMSLRETAKKCGLSASLLSQIERHQVAPSLSTLLKVSRALNIEPTFFLGDSSDNYPRIVRKGQGKHITFDESLCLEYLASDLPNRRIDPILVRLPHRKSSRLGPSVHHGEEFAFVLQGKVGVKFGDEEEVKLNEGDSVYFKSETPHHFQNIGEKVATIIFITTCS